MVLEGEYKELRVIYDGSLEEIVLKELEKSEIVKFSIIPKLKVSWHKKVKHLNTHIWPGEDAVLMVILEKEACYKLIENFLELKKGLNYNITFNISVRAIEYLNM